MAENDDKLHDAGTKNEASTLNDSEKLIVGAEMKQILKICGKKIHRFAAFLEVSDNTVRQSYGYSHTPIPLTVADALRTFVGEENYRLALQQIRNRPIV